MAFTGLEQRFNEKVNQLYAGAKNKFDDGRSSNGRTDEPFIVRRPGDGQPGIKLEGRSLPVVSAAQDVKRLTLFTISKRGLLFLAKQQLLQTGNTFEHTRVINPLFVVANAVPFLHVKRNLRPFALGGAVKSFLGKLGISNNQSMYGDVASRNMINLRKIGQLQQETFNKQAGTISKSNFIKKIPFIGQTVSAFAAKRSMGEVGDDGWTESRPELKSYPSFIINSPVVNVVLGNIFREYGRSISSGYRTYLQFSDKEESSTYKKTISSISPKYYIDSSAINSNLLTVSEYSITNNIIDRYENDKSVYGTSTVKNAIDDEINKNIATVDATITELGKNLTDPARGQAFLKYFDSDGGYYSAINGAPSLDTNAQKMAESYRQVNKKIRYITDPSNNMVGPENNSNPYNRINGKVLNENTEEKNKWDDPITISFAMGKDNAVRFRAFITDLQQRANPQYNAKQYIGRIEKFITYTGVQREISFTLNIIAFSKDEIEGVWTRINYLTGLVFPYGFNKGIMQPNITRLTIGNVYDNQPGYITALDTNFKDLSESWDIDDKTQVPIAATMRMSFTLIEKYTKIATSPFYGITEKNGNFNNQIPTAGKNATSTAATSTAAPTTTDVSSTEVSDDYDVVERNLINAYNVAVQRGATQREIDAIMQRTGDIRRGRMNPGVLPNRP
jgi:hypothetical protein